MKAPMIFYGQRFAESLRTYFVQGVWAWDGKVISNFANFF